MTKNGDDRFSHRSLIFRVLKYSSPKNIIVYDLIDG